MDLVPRVNQEGLSKSNVFTNMKRSHISPFSLSGTRSITVIRNTLNWFRNFMKIEFISNSTDFQFIFQVLKNICGFLLLLYKKLIDFASPSNTH